MNFHAEGSGSGTNGRTTSAHTHEPATTVAVSSIGSPPGALFSNAFQPACSKPAPSTASVMPSDSSCTGITIRRSCSLRLALLPCGAVAERRGAIGRHGDAFVGLEPSAGEHARFLENRIGDRADVRIYPPQIGNEVEMQRRRLDAFHGVASEPPEVRIGVRPLEVAEQHLLREQFLRMLEV